MTKSDLEQDQRRRRAGEIRSASLAYVRECARKHDILDLETFGRRRWPRDGVEKRLIMIEAMIDDIRSGIPVVDLWQRFEAPGWIARRLVGVSDNSGLYEVLERNEMAIGFRPRDIASWVWNGKMPAENAMEILGIESSREFEDFVARWLTGQDE